MAAAAASSARAALRWVWATPQITGTRPPAASMTAARTWRRAGSSRDAVSPVEPSGSRPCTPPARTCSTRRRVPASSTAPSRVSGEIRAGSTPRRFLSSNIAFTLPGPGQVEQEADGHVLVHGDEGGARRPDVEGAHGGLDAAGGLHLRARQLQLADIHHHVLGDAVDGQPAGHGELDLLAVA